MNMKLLLGFVLVILVSIPSLAKILILEVDSKIFPKHPAKVSRVACELEEDNCISYLSPEFHSDNFAKQFKQKVQSVNVINMSFTQQKPVFDNSYEGESQKVYEKYEKEFNASLAKYEAEKSMFKKIVLEHSDKLFVIASGNGIGKNILGEIGGFVKETSEIYPARVEGKNTIKVSAVKHENFSLGLWDKLELADYANYGLTYVDVGAAEAYGKYNFFKSEDDSTEYSNILPGTSFAAPLVSRLSDEVFKKYPKLLASQVKEIIMKSCYIKRIEHAIAASEDYKVNGKASKTFYAMNTRHVVKKKEALEEIGNILFVKSGGVVLPKLVKSCASHLANNDNWTVEQACLQAHADVLLAGTSRQEQLKKLWQVRDI